MGIERFGAEDGKRADACYEIYRATREADDPGTPVMPPRVFLGWLQVGFMGDPRETWLLEDAAGIGGWYLLELPARDNGHLGLLDLAVRPQRQRHGLGTALLRHAAGRAVAGGRQLLAGVAWAGSPGEAFAQAAGATWGPNEIRRAADTDALPPERLAGLRDAARAASAGYSLISWAGPTPERAPGPGGRAQPGGRRRAARSEPPGSWRGTRPGSGRPTSGRRCMACCRTP